MERNNSRLFRELECPVCMTVRQGRIYECPNAHIICQKCHDKLGSRRCPACKDEMPDPPNRNVAIERIVDRDRISKISKKIFSVMKNTKDH